MTFTEVGPWRWRVGKAKAIATWVEFTPRWRIVNLARAVGDQSLPASTRNTYRVTLGRIAGHLRLRGAHVDGLVVVGG